MKLKSIAVMAAAGMALSGIAKADIAEFFDLASDISVYMGAKNPSRLIDIDYDGTSWASITGAELWLALSDDADRALESAALPSLGLNTPIVNMTGKTYYFAGDVSSEVTTGGPDTFSVALWRHLGEDFQYHNAKLVVDFVPVPEASDLWMLAAGLLAVGGIAVKRKSFNQL